jgi:hypothetical protein
VCTAYCKCSYKHGLSASLWSSFDLDLSAVSLQRCQRGRSRFGTHQRTACSDPIFSGLMMYRGQKSTEDFQHNMGTVLCRSGEQTPAFGMETSESLQSPKVNHQQSKWCWQFSGFIRANFATLSRERHNSKHCPLQWRSGPFLFWRYTNACEPLYQMRWKGGRLCAKTMLL